MENNPHRKLIVAKTLSNDGTKGLYLIFEKDATGELVEPFPHIALGEPGFEKICKTLIKKPKNGFTLQNLVSTTMQVGTEAHGLYLIFPLSDLEMIQFHEVFKKVGQYA